jgi:hypothetical protein
MKAHYLAGRSNSEDAMIGRLILCMTGLIAAAACRSARQELREPPCVASDTSSAVRVQVIETQTTTAVADVYVRAGDWFHGGSTDNRGWACIDGLAPGEIRLTTERLGFHGDSSTISLAGGEVGTARFTLRRKPAPCCRLDGPWRIRFELDRPAGMYQTPAARVIDGSIVFSTRLPNPMPRRYDVADSIVRFEFGHAPVDFTPFFGGPVAPDVSRSVFGGPGGGEMLFREVVGVVPTGDSVTFTIIPRMSHGSLWFEGRIAHDTVRGTWTQSAYAAGAEGRFTMWRVAPTAETDSLVSHVISAYERLRREAEQKEAERRVRQGQVRLRVYDEALKRYVSAKYSFTRDETQPGGYLSTSERSSDTGWGRYLDLEPGDYEVRLFEYPCGKTVYFANRAYVRQHMPVRVTIRSGERKELDLVIDRRMIVADTSYDNPTARSCTG